MIYHEVRDINRKKKNYLICNKRERGRWVKKAKFIGIGKLDKDEIAQKKKEFEIELLRNKKYVYLTKSNIEKIEQFKKEYHKKRRV